MGKVLRDMEAYMKKQLKGILAAVAPIVCLGIWGGSAKAATLNVYLQEDGVNGGAITLVDSGAGFTPDSFSGDYGDFSITLLGSASTNTANLSKLLSSNVSVQNNSTDSKTLSIYVSETDYTLPLGSPLLIEAGLGGSIVSGTTLGTTGVFQAFFDQNNNVLGLADQSSANADIAFAGTTFDTGSKTGSTIRGFPDFSLSSRVTLALSGGGSVGFQDHINVTAPLPSAAWVGIGLMGALFVARRRAQA